MCVCLICFFFFKQKTAYEMRISDWSSDVCSSDLTTTASAPNSMLALSPALAARRMAARRARPASSAALPETKVWREAEVLPQSGDRKSVVSGKSVSVRVDLGGRRILKKNKYKPNTVEHDKLTS